MKKKLLGSIITIILLVYFTTNFVLAENPKDYGNEYIVHEFDSAVYDVIWDGEKYIGIGIDGIVYSYDGHNWSISQQNNNASKHKSQIAFNGQEYIITGELINKKTEKYIGTDNNNFLWTNLGVGDTTYELGLAASQDGLYYQSISGEYIEGIWYFSGLSPSNLTWDGEKYVLYSLSPLLSYDGETFIKADISFNDPYLIKKKGDEWGNSVLGDGLIFDGKIFLSIRDSTPNGRFTPAGYEVGWTTVYKSEDGINWDIVWEERSTAENYIELVCNNNASYYFIIDDLLYCSKNGIDWELQNSKLVKEINNTVENAHIEEPIIHSVSGNEYVYLQFNNKLYISNDMDNFYCAEFDKEIGAIIYSDDNVLITTSKVIDISKLIPTLSLNPMTSYITLSDINITDWFFDSVISLVNYGIISGYEDSTFKPNNYMTVDQFIKTMIVTLGYDLQNGDDYWAQPYIDKARELKLIDITEYRTMNESQTVVTRVQMAKICERTLELLEGEKEYTLTDYIKNSASDRSEIELTGLSEYVYHMWELGIITGYPDRSFKPNDPLTRAQGATVIYRIIDSSQRRPFEKLEEPTTELSQDIIQRLKSYPYYGEGYPYMDFERFYGPYGPFASSNDIIEDFYSIEPSPLNSNQILLTNGYLVYRPSNNGYHAVRGILQETLEDGTIIEQDVEYIYKPDKYNPDTGLISFELVTMIELSSKNKIEVAQ